MTPTPNTEPIWLIDTTLRDGEQSPGVAFSRQTKETIASMLTDAGIDEIEVGTPAMGESEQEDIRAINRLNLSCRLTCWCRARRSDIEDAARCDTGSIHISFPVSAILMRAMNMDPSWVLDQLRDLLIWTHTRFPFVSVGAQDATRAELSFLKVFTEQAHQFGACRVRMADTVGIATPFSIVAMLNELIINDNASIEFHGHNDLGMATANAVCAVQAGAKALSVTINGLGERAGNAALEEVVMALMVSGERKSRIRPACLPALCNYVASASGRPIPAGKPITGSLVFTHESSIHRYGMQRDTRSYEPFSGCLLGRHSEFVVGKHSGRAVSLCIQKHQHNDLS